MAKTTTSEPSLKPWYRVYFHDEQVIFHYGDSVVCLNGQTAATIIPRLLPLLDGRHSMDEIALVAGGDAKVARAAVSLLDRFELLMDGVAPKEDSAAARTAVFLSSIGGASVTEDVAQRLAAARISVLGSSNVAGEILRGLHLSGSGSADVASFSNFALSDADLVIVAPTISEVPRLRELNACAIGKRQPWLQVLPYDGRFAAIGPIYIPGETACYACFQLRRAANVKYPQEFFKLEQATSAFEQCMPLDLTVAGLAVLHALRWIGARDAALAGSFISFAPLSDRATAAHHVLRVPRCTACSGAVNVTAPSPWYES